MRPYLFLQSGLDDVERVVGRRADTAAEAREERVLQRRQLVPPPQVGGQLSLERLVASASSRFCKEKPGWFYGEWKLGNWHECARPPDSGDASKTNTVESPVSFRRPLHHTAMAVIFIDSAISGHAVPRIIEFCFSSIP